MADHSSSSARAVIDDSAADTVGVGEAVQVLGPALLVLVGIALRAAWLLSGPPRGSA